MFLIDTAAGRIVSDDEIKARAGGCANPTTSGCTRVCSTSTTLPDRVRVQPNHDSVVRRQISFGYTEEELRILLTPMAASGAEPLGSMGTDTPTAVLSQRSRLLYDYFVELFAQVTNPPLDAIREAIVTSMARVMGPEHNLLEPTAASCRQIGLTWPVLDNDELNKIVHINDDGEQPGLKTEVLRALYDVERGGEGLADALEDLRIRACEAIAKGARTLVISDRDSDHTKAPIPSLLAVSAVHHHLVRTKERTTVALVVESGDAREVHHIAMLIGFGAAAVNPYLAFESIEDLIREGELTGIEPATAVRNYLKALGKGVMKVMSKMGISTVASYTGAQAFEAIGLNRDVDRRVLHRHPEPARRRRSRRASPRRSSCATAGPTRRTRPSACTAGSRSAASTRSAGRASCTCSPRKSSSCCSIRRVPGDTTSSGSTPTRSTGWPARAARCAACSSSRRACARRCRSTRSSPSSRSSPGSTPVR